MLAMFLTVLSAVSMSYMQRTQVHKHLMIAKAVVQFRAGVLSMITDQDQGLPGTLCSKKANKAWQKAKG